MKKTTCLSLLMMLLGWSQAVTAAPSAEKGLAIATEAEQRGNGFGDFTAMMKMVLKNQHGESSERIIQVKTLEVQDDGDKGLLIFKSPRDVKGTALLTFSHKTSDNDQWLYLPALKRVKRINSRNKTGSFMGSEFSYEDIGGQEIEKYTHQWLRDETYEQQDCFVLERRPIHPENSGYTRQVIWMDKQEYRVLKVDYYDRKKTQLKTLLISGYQKYMDKYWQPSFMVITNHQNGKSTELHWTDYQFNTGLTNREFNKNNLTRKR